MELSDSNNQALAAISLDFAFTFTLTGSESNPIGTDLLNSTPSILHAFGVYAKLLVDYENMEMWKAYGLYKA